MHPKKCAECGGAVEQSSAPLTFEVRGETVTVEGIDHGLCAGCGEVYMSLDAAELLQKRAVEKSKAARRLLAPGEIRDFRKSLGLSQSGLEALLGLGAKTVVRWEKGTVFQNPATDLLLRLLREMPELVSVVRSGVLYSGTASCAPKAARIHMSRGWVAAAPGRNHLRVVSDRDNSAAA